MDKQIKDMTGEEIALALQARYQGIAQCQQEITVLNQELQKRINATAKKEENNAANKG